MESLANMDNEERAYLLAELFPNNVKFAVAEIRKVCTRYLKSAKSLQKNWDDEYFSFLEYKSFAVEIAEKIDSNRIEIVRNPIVFSEYLFSDYPSIFTVNCLKDYAKQKHCHPAFAAAIILFFETVDQ